MGPTNVCCRRGLFLRRPPPCALRAIAVSIVAFLAMNLFWAGLALGFLAGGLAVGRSHWHGSSPVRLHIPYVCGAGGDALALELAPKPVESD